MLTGVTGTAPPLAGSERTGFTGLFARREILVVLALLARDELLPETLPNEYVPPAPVWGWALAGIG